jgi:hypothetical protein
VIAFIALEVSKAGLSTLAALPLVVRIDEDVHLQPHDPRSAPGPPR